MLTQDTSDGVVTAGRATRIGGVEAPKPVCRRSLTIVAFQASGIWLGNAGAGD